MCEITNENFKEKYKEVKETLENCKFIAIDLEFSALNPIQSCSPSLFDNPRKRYAKLRKNVEYTIPLQVGVTAFRFDADKNHYTGKCFTFYVKPALFAHVNNRIIFESSSFEFLRLYKFDFNKFVYGGIPYISSIQEEELRRQLANKLITENSSNFNLELQRTLESQEAIVKAWYDKAATGDVLTLPKLSEQFKNITEFKYFSHRHFRNRFKHLWTYEVDELITFKRVTDEEFSKLQEVNNLEEELLLNLLGFTRIYRLLKKLQKPIIGHNVLMDILILIKNFEGSLPVSYYDFKKLANNSFPTLFDTKHIWYNVRNIVPKEKRMTYSDLKALYVFFKDGLGRHLVMNSPSIDIDNTNDEINDKYHEAGWDSFCTGYIFIRMAYINVYHAYPKSKKFMSSELIYGLSKYKNCLNIVRGCVDSMKMDGVDPESRRPPRLVVESLRKDPIDLLELSSILCAYADVEVKHFSWNNSRAIVAVDNFGSARRIMQNFKGHSDFKVNQYNILKHSPYIRLCLWGGITLSGVMLIWFGKDIIRR